MLQILSQDDLKALTGLKRRSGIVAWLNARGWVYETTANGWPVVSVSYAEGKLGGATTPARARPNLDALRKLQAA